MSGGKGRCKGNLETFSALLATFVAVKTAQGVKWKEGGWEGGSLVWSPIFFTVD